jgi:hypothetical protein
MIFQLVFFFAVSIVHGIQQNLVVSGALYPVSVGSGDLCTMSITGSASANPSPSKPMLNMSGGVLTINGGGFILFCSF